MGFSVRLHSSPCEEHTEFLFHRQPSDFIFVLSCLPRRGQAARMLALKKPLTFLFDEHATSSRPCSLFFSPRSRARLHFFPQPDRSFLFPQSFPPFFVRPSVLLSLFWITPCPSPADRCPAYLSLSIPRMVARLGPPPPTAITLRYRNFLLPQFLG